MTHQGYWGKTPRGKKVHFYLPGSRKKGHPVPVCGQETVRIRYCSREWDPSDPDTCPVCQDIYGWIKKGLHPRPVATEDRPL